MSEPSPSPRVSIALIALTVVLVGVLALVALNNATSPEVVMPVSIAAAAGLLALGMAAKRS